MRGPSFASLQFGGKFLDLLTDCIRELLEGGIAQSSLSDTEHSLSLQPVHGYCRIPILKRTLGVTLDEFYLPPTHNCPQAMRRKVQLFFKFKAGPRKFSCSQKHFAQLHMQAWSIRRCSQ